MEPNLHVHDTAFLTSTYRSSNQELSKDPFAQLWNTPGTDAWVAEHVAAISPHEPHLHCLRNRYFFEQLHTLYGQGAISLLINFGSGFSMYPFVLPEDLQHIEVDLPPILAHKQQHLQRWMDNGTLPHRNIHFIGADFMTSDSRWVEEIMAQKEDQKAFILIEGVLFFLNEQGTQKTFDIFDRILHSGDFIGSVSFQETIEGTAVFNRLIDFCIQRLNYQHGFHYQVVPDSFYYQRTGYSCIDHQDGLTLNQQFSPHYPLPDRSDFLNENMYLLRKI